MKHASGFGIFLFGWALSLACPRPAIASELIAGVFAHDTHLPFDLSGQEQGSVDLNLGWRGPRLGLLHVIGSPAPHVYVLANTGGKTSFISVGFGWKIGSLVYLRPGIGLAVHNGTANGAPNRIDFGSRLLFAPEMSAGIRVSPRLSVEATLLHFSHARLFSAQNPGIDNLGVRMNVAF